MAVLKYYDGTDWEPVASALVGPTGATGVTGPTGATGAAAAASGLTLVSTTSFSAVASVSLAQDTFTSTYDNYRIVGKGTFSGAGQELLRFRLRTTGSDNTTSNYTWHYYERANSVAGNGFSGSETSSFVGAVGTTGWAFSADFFSPKESALTVWLAKGVGKATNDSTTYFNNSYFNATTVFDSITFFPPNGNFTGAISVYGMAK